ncbi:hypothetical protein F5Y16DRAFT_404756 [Xylariaceae sp. FL0255]|nr:hypothetical protein F5Y16DRAFT_404756 [Xylariaceae sp. FL0255]
MPGGTTSKYPAGPPDGEIANRGGPNGGDMRMIYDPNDVWQNWMINITSLNPYMAMRGNYDHGVYASLQQAVSRKWRHQQRVVLLRRRPGTTHRLRRRDGETDFANSTQHFSLKDLTEDETVLPGNQTDTLDTCPFGRINGFINGIEAYEQHRFPLNDLENSDVTKKSCHKPPAHVSFFIQHLPTQHTHTLVRARITARIKRHIDYASIKDNNTYYSDSGVFYGFTKLTVANDTPAKSTFTGGDSGNAGGESLLLKRLTSNSTSNPTTKPVSTSSAATRGAVFTTFR